MTVQSYEDLKAWQKAIELVAAIYTATASFPEAEIFGIISQMRRAAASVPSNIAEGQGRLTTGEFRHFVGIARGSLQELETQVHLARRLGYLQEASFRELLRNTKEVIRIVNGLLNSLDEKVRQSRASRY